ncbi:hypothetical protein CASFOL_013837 [Castilleja foliolosa]|uniref:DUF7887 domain-containing protein n=1 Tax=Castilleja foliolosa TaxID=1961234 RepID=A0ABD3DP11_9LAMI
MQITILRNGTAIIRPYLINPTMAKKNNSENSNYKSNKPLLAPLKLTSTSKILIQSAAVGLFALGFIDAGYSGDWSRIGVISKGAEDLLKSAAFLVVPFCIFVIFYLFRKVDEE